MANLLINCHLGAEPKVIQNENTKFVSIRVAENKRYFDKTSQVWKNKEPNWFSVLCFGPLAEKVSLLKKGDRIYIDGSLDSYKKVRNDEIRYETSITAKNIWKIDSLVKDDGIPNFISNEEINF